MKHNFDKSFFLPGSTYKDYNKCIKYVLCNKWHCNYLDREIRDQCNLIVLIKKLC